MHDTNYNSHGFKFLGIGHTYIKNTQTILLKLTKQAPDFTLTYSIKVWIGGRCIANKAKAF